MTATRSKRTDALVAPPSTSEPAPAQQAADRSIAPRPAEGGAGSAARDRRFMEGVRRLRVGGASLKLDERLLLVIGGVLAPLGLIVVLLGWWGASHSGYVFEQVPYLISGGLFGVALVFLGAFFYFAHWLTQLLKEQRAQSAALLEALQRLEDKVAATPGAAAAVVESSVHRNGSAPAATALVATERGSMAHLPDCVVVAGKPALRSVTRSDGLSPCKLCEPF